MAGRGCGERIAEVLAFHDPVENLFGRYPCQAIVVGRGVFDQTLGQGNRSAAGGGDGGDGIVAAF